MKVLILSDPFPPHALGGAGTATYALCRGLSRAGAEVAVISVHQQRGQGVIRDDLEFPVYRIYSRYPLRWVAYLSLYNPFTLPHVARLLDELRPDVVHAHNVHIHLSYAALRLAAQRDSPVIFTSHDVMPFAFQKFVEFINPQARGVPTAFDYRLRPGVNLRRQRLRYNPLRNPAIRYVLWRYVDVLITPSRALQEAHRANRVLARRMEVIPYGIDVADFEIDLARVAAFRAERGLTGERLILFAGRLSGYKGGEQALRALQKVAERVKNVRLLVLARPGGYTSRMADLADALGIGERIHFAGWLSGEELHVAYNAADVVITPSVCFDTFPMVNLEAMAAARPVVGTCFGGTPEAVLDGETGYIVNPYDVDMLTERLTRLMTDEQLARRMGMAGLERVRAHFSMDGVATCTLDLYRQLCASRGSG
jgi:glycosyltransferase involved in cell wall biosynthesis